MPYTLYVEGTINWRTGDTVQCLAPRHPILRFLARLIRPFSRRLARALEARLVQFTVLAVDDGGTTLTIDGMPQPDAIPPFSRAPIEHSATPSQETRP